MERFLAGLIAGLLFGFMGGCTFMFEDFKNSAQPTEIIEDIKGGK